VERHRESIPIEPSVPSEQTILAFCNVGNILTNDDGLVWEPNQIEKHWIPMFNDKETFIVETCLLVAVPVSIGLAVLSAILF
jgi:hypothetical protein